MQKSIRELQRQLPGWRMDYTKGGHLKFTHPSGATVFMSKTPSDYRSRKNFLAKCKRSLLERRHG